MTMMMMDGLMVMMMIVMSTVSAKWISAPVHDENDMHNGYYMMVEVSNMHSEIIRQRTNAFAKVNFNKGVHDMVVRIVRGGLPDNTCGTNMNPHPPAWLRGASFKPCGGPMNVFHDLSIFPAAGITYYHSPCDVKSKGTWLLSKKDKKYYFIAGKIEDGTEVGTKHVYLAAGGLALMGGEFTQNSTHIMFDLNSGTYMTNIMAQHDCKHFNYQMALKQLLAMCKGVPGQKFVTDPDGCYKDCNVNGDIGARGPMKKKGGKGPKSYFDALNAAGVKWSKSMVPTKSFQLLCAKGTDHASWGCPKKYCPDGYPNGFDKLPFGVTQKNPYRAPKFGISPPPKGGDVFHGNSICGCKNECWSNVHQGGKDAKPAAENAKKSKCYKVK